MDQITKRALQLFDYALDNNLAGNSGELCKKIELVPTNLYGIKKGGRTFTHAQLQNLAKLTRANMNWVYGFSKTMFREEEENTKDPIQKIRQALTEIEKERGKK